MHSFNDASVDMCYCEICRMRRQIKSIRTSTLPLSRVYFGCKLQMLFDYQNIVLGQLFEIMDGLGIDTDELWK